MDIFAHALWAGAGIGLTHRRWPVKPAIAAATVVLAALPDIPHLRPHLVWFMFGGGTFAALSGYAIAVPGQEPAMLPVVALLSHHLHCVMHSAIVAGAVTLGMWVTRRTLWIPLLGWWSHIVIDIFTHSGDYYPSPVFYPITQRGFDGIAWNTPWFMALNYAALVFAWLWIILKARRQHQLGA
jgi:LexA-binding, inner membrane-associated putative hydrolase